jgi:multimeric flavodoxin WrbA
MMKLSNILSEINLMEGDKKSMSKLEKTIEFLDTKKKVLLLTTSNRWEGDKEVPKSSLLAKAIKKSLGDKITILDVPKLKIYPCEGNVSTKDGDKCGLKDAMLKSKTKNPTGDHRCWASINNPDDELWKVSKELLESDAVLFFASIRWGQANAFYQKLIERLNWLENRHTTLKEDNIIKNINSGFICVGQNWNGENVVETQKEVHKFYGFKVDKKLYWNWQYTQDEYDETAKSYKDSFGKFEGDFNL